MPKVTVRWFAVLREWRGVDAEEVEITSGETAGALYRRLIPPGPQGALPVAYARNLEYVSASTALEDGDEVAFLPPLGGG